jgi:hypothetical protein
MRGCVVAKYNCSDFDSISGPDIKALGNKDGGRNSLSEHKNVRISRFSGYLASGYQHLTVHNFTTNIYLIGSKVVVTKISMKKLLPNWV